MANVLHLLLKVYIYIEYFIDFCSCDESFLGRDCDIEATKITMKKYSPPLELTAKIWKYLYISLDPSIY